MSKLDVINIKKKFDKKYILEDISFSSNENEFITILGPSGCGKTTLLRIIAGLEITNSGNVLIDNKSIIDKEAKERNIAMVFQTYALYPQKNVYNNLAFPLKIAKVDKETIDKKVKNIARILEIDDILYRKPETLSGGQKQRVAIGKAMIRNPKVFLFDEPFSNLDAVLREKMKFEIKKLHQQVKSVFLYVTHDQNEAMSLGDRIIVMKEGVIQQIGTPYEIYNKPSNKFVATFIGNPKMNIINNKVYSWLTGQEMNTNSCYGIRPEKITICESDSKNNFGIISSLEDSGKEIVYNIDYELNNLVVSYTRNEEKKEYKVGDKVICKADTKNFYYFDLKTGKTIY